MYMKKILFTIVIVGCIICTAKAQQYTRSGFSIGPEINFPSQSVYNIGYGASARLDLPVSGKVGISLTGGYTKLHYKGSIVSVFGDQKPNEFVPLKAGIIYGVGNGLYLSGELGDAMEVSSNVNGNKRNLFVFGLGPGFLFGLSDKQAIDLGIRYEQWSQHELKQVAIRVAYRIGW